MANSMWLMETRRLALMFALALPACGLEMSGVRVAQAPGNLTALDGGAMAVDDRSDEIYLLTRTPRSGQQRTDGVTPAVWVVEPDAGRVHELVSLPGASDVHLGFVPGGLLLVHRAFETVREDGGWTEMPRRYVERLAGGQRAAATAHRVRVPDGPVNLAPSRRYAAIASDHGTALLSTTTLAQATLDRTVTQVRWLTGGDRFVAIECGDAVRLSRWSVTEPTADLLLLDFDGEVVLTGARCEGNVGEPLAMAPDDRTAAVALASGPPKALRRSLAIVDLEAGVTRRVDDVRGPVTFDRDGSRVVGWRGAHWLAVVDTATLAVAPYRQTWFDADIGYHASSGRDVVLMGNALWGAQRLALLDLSTGLATRLGPPGVRLSRFVEAVSPDAVWLVDHEALFRVDLAAPAIELVVTEAAPRWVSWLPIRQRLVLDDAYSDRLVFFDPESRRSTLSSAPIPGRARRYSSRRSGKASLLAAGAARRGAFKGSDSSTRHRDNSRSRNRDRTPGST